jgi:archaemetzincin
VGDVNTTAVLLASLLLLAPAASSRREPVGKPLPPGTRGEWRWVHKEKAQTLEQYKAAKPVRPTEKRTKIYLLPWSTRPPMEAGVNERLRMLLEASFGRAVEWLPAQRIPARAYDPKRRRIEIRACLPTLVKTLPDDALFLLAVTDRDIRLPKSRYTFGWGSMRLRVGICSSFRLRPDRNRTRRRARYFGLALHEATHMLSVPHCTKRRCLMNGAMDLKEADRRPLRMCWECKSKVCWNLGLDSAKRDANVTRAWDAAAVTR